MLGGVVLALIVTPTLLDGWRAHQAARVPVPTAAAVVRQQHPAGCGAALLATLLARAGRPVPQDALLAAEPPEPDGITLAAFRALAEMHGLSGVWRMRGSGAVPDGAFVAHLSRPSGHFVYVAGRVGAYLHVLDPARGGEVWHVDHFRRRWSGRYLRFGEPA